MLICTQQSVGPTHWQDVDVPEGVTTVKQWAERLRKTGVTGEFRATELELADDETWELEQAPITRQFRIVASTAYEVEYAREAD
jgi:hypothetical protein